MQRCWFSFSLPRYSNDNSHSSCLLCLKIHSQRVKTLTPPFTSSTEWARGSARRDLLLTIAHLSHRESFQYPTTKRWVFPLNVGHSIWASQRLREREREEVSSVSVFRHRMCWGLWAEIPTFTARHGERVTATHARASAPLPRTQ